MLIEALLPELRDVALECNVDIALVLNDDRDHAAIQAFKAHTQVLTGLAARRGRWYTWTPYAGARLRRTALLCVAPEGEADDEADCQIRQNPC